MHGLQLARLQSCPRESDGHTIASGGSSGPACRAPFQGEKLVPAAKLTAVHIPLRPTEAVLAPLPGARDVLPDGRTIHTLLLTYKLTVAEAGKHTVTLPLLNRCYLSQGPVSCSDMPKTIHAGVAVLAMQSWRTMLTCRTVTSSGRHCRNSQSSGDAVVVTSVHRCRYVYDGELEGQMSMLFDSNKRLIKVSDIYPEDVQLGKGTYTIRAQLRHEDRGEPWVSTWSSRQELANAASSQHVLF